MAQVIHGDCLEVLKTLPDNSVEAIVTDPPAGIAFMNKDWDKDKGGRDKWIAWMSEVATECLRVIKPGGHALVWALPRTSHWTGMAWEDGGWEPRDKCVHLFGSGFPKSLDVSKAIDKAAGAEREVVGQKDNKGRCKAEGWGLNNGGFDPITAPATPSAKQWEGWGTALKPGHEDWWLFRKPLAEKTVAANVLEHGTGGLNIDGCRVAVQQGDRKGIGGGSNFSNLQKVNSVTGFDRGALDHSTGRFPANVIHDGSDEVMAIFPDRKVAPSGKPSRDNKATGCWGGYNGFTHYDDSGSAARFFYCAKASKRDRDEGLDGFEDNKPAQEYRFGAVEGNPRRPQRCTALQPVKNTHPTVKNTELMRYLCRLITPPGGTILDPFCGSGSTGKGATLEGFNFIGIEQDAEYCEIARARIAYVEPVKEPTLEERVQWLETQVKAQGTQIKKMQNQQLSLFG